MSKRRKNYGSVAEFIRKSTLTAVVGLLVQSASPFAAFAADLSSSSPISETPLVARLCTSCHGLGGASAGPATPVIAGLSQNYLIGAMLAYKYADDLAAAQDVVDGDPDLADVVVMARHTTIMGAVAAAYDLHEIKALAAFFSSKQFVRPAQQTDAVLVSSGAGAHEQYCEKCHENGGQSTADDVGLLAGQWKLYLEYALEDFGSGQRESPKKMAEKLKSIHADRGDQGFTELIHYYASQSDTEKR